MLIHQDRQHPACFQDARALGQAVLALDQF